MKKIIALVVISFLSFCSPALAMDKDQVLQVYRQLADAAPSLTLEQVQAAVGWENPNHPLALDYEFQTSSIKLNETTFQPVDMDAALTIILNKTEQRLEIVKQLKARCTTEWLLLMHTTCFEQMRFINDLLYTLKNLYENAHFSKSFDPYKAIPNREEFYPKFLVKAFTLFGQFHELMLYFRERALNEVRPRPQFVYNSWVNVSRKDNLQIYANMLINSFNVHAYIAPLKATEDALHERYEL